MSNSHNFLLGGDDEFLVPTNTDATAAAFASAQSAAHSEQPAQSQQGNRPPSSSAADNPFMLTDNNSGNSKKGGKAKQANPGVAAAPAATSFVASDYITTSDPDRLKSELAQTKEQMVRLQQALAQKDLEFEQKENEYKETIRKLEYPTKKNWPWCLPMVHHDIGDDIVTETRKVLVRLLYTAYLVSSVLLLWNFLVVSIAWFSGVLDKVLKNAWLSFFSAALAVLIGVPASGWLWYFRFYNLCMETKVVSTSWYVFFFNFTCLNMLYCVYCISGFYYGTAGFYLLSYLSAYSHNTRRCLDMDNGKCGRAKFAVYLFASSGVAWTVFLLFSAYVLYKIWRYYRLNQGDNPADPPLGRTVKLMSQLM